MSGIAILSIAASVIQIVEWGWKLSVKLFAFSRKIKNANRSIEAISKDIAATGAVLHQLGTELHKDENARLCSNEAISTAREMVADCQQLLQDLENAIEVKDPRRKASWLQRANCPDLELHIESLRSNLERLKSSLMLMPNTLISLGR
jgi:chromosome segregation ATPase